MLCPLVRWQLSGALDGAAPGRLATAHLARCERCQAMAASLEQLHGRLVAGARAAIPPPAPVPALTSPARPRRSPARSLDGRAVLVLAAVGAAAAIALFARPGNQPDRAESSDGVTTASPATGEPPATGANPVPREAVGESAEPAEPATRLARGAMVAQLGVLFAEPEPLRAELDALASDGRRGALAILHIGGVGDWVSRTP